MMMVCGFSVIALRRAALQIVVIAMVIVALVDRGADRMACRRQLV